MSVPYAALCLTAICVLSGWAVAAGSSGAGAPGGRDTPLLAADFEQDPCAAGWQAGADKGKTFRGRWAEPAAGSRGRFLLVEAGHWQTPPLPAKPFEYCRLSFRAKAAAEGYWAAEYFDASGAMLEADHYDALPASADWREHECCLRANANAATVRIRFIARRTPLAVDDVRLEPIARPAVRAWADRVYAALRPLDYAPPEGRLKLLPRTMERLAKGPALRIVLLGDSIANDTSHSAFDALLERAYPNCRVEVVNSCRGGTGCQWYRQEGRIKPYVLAFRPDLLVVAGISHGYDHEAIGDAIRQVRAGRDCEVLVLTGAICPRERTETGFVEMAMMPREAACEVIRQYPARLAAVAAQEKAELFDIGAAWDAYIARSPHPHAWYMRDAIHANTAGKHVIGRILLRYFTTEASRG